MPALVLYNNRTFRLKWLGNIKAGPFAGMRRARIQALKGNMESFWVPATELTFVDQPVKKDEKGIDKPEDTV